MGTICGSPSDLLKALSIIESEGPSRGLVLNRSKCLVHIPLSSSSSNPLPLDIPSSSDGFVLLGCPIGPPSFCHSFILELTETCRNLTGKLALLHDSHIELTLLRSCLSFSKIGYNLRTCPPSSIREATISFDEFSFRYSLLTSWLALFLLGPFLRPSCPFLSVAPVLDGIHSTLQLPF